MLDGSSVKSNSIYCPAVAAFGFVAVGFASAYVPAIFELESNSDGSSAPSVADALPVSVQMSDGVLAVSSLANVARGDWKRIRAVQLAVRVRPCSPSNEILTVWRRMHTSGVGVLPVVSKKSLIGVVKMSDIERFIYLKGMAKKTTKKHVRV